MSAEDMTLFNHRYESFKFYIADIGKEQFCLRITQILALHQVFFFCNFVFFFFFEPRNLDQRSD
jgi:hypothetical protein